MREQWEEEDENPLWFSLVKGAMAQRRLSIDALADRLGVPHFSKDADPDYWLIHLHTWAGLNKRAGVIALSAELRLPVGLMAFLTGTYPKDITGIATMLEMMNKHEFQAFTELWLDCHRCAFYGKGRCYKHAVERRQVSESSTRPPSDPIGPGGIIPPVM